MKLFDLSAVEADLRSHAIGFSLEHYFADHESVEDYPAFVAGLKSGIMPEDVQVWEEWERLPHAQLGEHMDNLTDALYDYAVRVLSEVVGFKDPTGFRAERFSYWVARVEITTDTAGKYTLHRGSKLGFEAGEADAASDVLSHFTERECPWEQDRTGPFDIYEMGDQLVQVLNVVQVPRIQYQIFEEN